MTKKFLIFAADQTIASLSRRSPTAVPCDATRDAVGDRLLNDAGGYFSTIRFIIFNEFDSLFFNDSIDCFLIIAKDQRPKTKDQSLSYLIQNQNVSRKMAGYQDDFQRGGRARAGSA
jgi:hypothetical protein